MVRSFGDSYPSRPMRPSAVRRLLVVLSTVSLGGALAACQSPADTPATAPAVEPTPSAPGPRSDTSTAGAPVAYNCAPTNGVTVRYPTDSTAVVAYDGREIPMTQAVSGSGSRYVGGGFEWHVKGSEGLFGTVRPDGTSDSTLLTCGEGGEETAP